MLVAAFVDRSARAVDIAERIDGYRQFALEHAGDATAGEQLFLRHDSLACTNCHRVTGAELSGPNLDGIGDKYTRRELIEHILRPSLAIKPGYSSRPW
jgi:cytochrome c553